MNILSGLPTTYAAGDNRNRHDNRTYITTANTHL